MAIDFGSSLSSIAKLPTKLNWEDHITPSMNTLDARWIYFQFHREHIKQDIPNCFFVSHSMNLQPDNCLLAISPLKQVIWVTYTTNRFSQIIDWYAIIIQF